MTINEMHAAASSAAAIAGTLQPNLRASAAGLVITEVPSFEHARIHGESNLNTFRDGRRVLKTILTEWHRR